MPLRTFSVADGLAHNNITQIFQDSKGYLWLGTGEGLSRFDGYAFTNYDTKDGLRGANINDITEDRTGRLWIAINDGGIARLLDSTSERVEEPRRKFVSFEIAEIPRSNNVGKIIFDADNRLWCATEAGVYRARSTEVADRDFELVDPSHGDTISRAALVDSRDRLWFGFRDRVLRVDKGGLTYFDLQVDGTAFVNAIVEDGRGSFFASTTNALYEFSESRSTWEPVRLSLKRAQTIETIRPANDEGSLWIGTNAGAINIRDGIQTVYSTTNGLASNVVSAVFSDRDNRLWFGTRGGGLNSQANRAIVKFSDPAFAKPYRFSEDPSGTVYVQTGCNDPAFLSIGDQSSVPVATVAERSGNCKRNYFLRTIDGRWVTTVNGVMTITDRLGHPGRSIEAPEGRRVEKFLEVYEDQFGKLWLSAEDRDLYVAEPGEPTPHFELAAAAIGASLIMSDSRGILWIANNVFLGRLRNGTVDEIKGEDTVLGRQITPRSLFEDSTGRIWIGTRHDGVLYTDDAAASVPTFKRITADDGLPSDAIWTITEDDEGRMYFGTNRGVVRYERSGALRRLTSVDGMSESIVNALFRDSRGRIWVGSDGGISRIVPAALDGNSPPPPIFITNASVEGEEIPIDETGSTHVLSGDLDPDHNSISIKFVGLTLKGERSLNYSYMLEGSDHNWSTPSSQREINLVNLGPGSYRLLVKAIDQRGIESVSPAVMEFRILSPFWLRWWFVSLVAMSLGAGLYALYRYRVSRVLEIERVRTRIATDLHDDIGSNLTRIALMTEVLNQQGGNGASSSMLPSIANIARESVASMNDIVWAISPEHDSVLDLTRRMRQHAEEVFTIRDIAVAFVSDSSSSELKLPIGVRRDVLLIFKEAVNNAARHSKCTSVAIDFECRSERLRLRIADDGVGFKKNLERDGHGLASLERRAAALAGTLVITTAPGEGTTVKFEMPL